MVSEAVETVAPFIFTLNKDLLDLNAIEMDSVLKHIIFDILKCDDTIHFTNDKGISRKFKVNRGEGLLEGRGIKGFFSPYDAQHLYAVATTDGNIRVSGNPPVTADTLLSLGIHPQHIDKTRQVLSSMLGLQTTNEKWFSLYHEAVSLLNDPEDNQLLCLPFLRGLDIYNYQVRTALAVFKRFKGRVLLCDEVGLGKTVEAGMAMTEYIIRGMVRRILILVPPSLVEQWSTEMKYKFNQNFIKYDDPAFKSMGDEAWLHYPKVIASIHTAKRQGNRVAILKESYDLIIVDEAHHLKNQKTIAWDFVNKIKKKYIMLLTATPVQNKLEDLYSLITLLKPGQLKTYNYFKQNFVRDREGMEAKNVDQLRPLLTQVMIRNKRSDVDIRFTKRKAMTTYVSLSAPEQELHDQLSAYIRRNYRNKESQLTRFTLKNLQELMGSSFHALVPTLDKLARNENLAETDRRIFMKYQREAERIVGEYQYENPKALQLLKILSEFNDKLIVFTKYRTTQTFLSNFLRDKGLSVAEFNGSMQRKQKEEQIALFRDKAQILVSTESGGEGRNMQFCNGLVNYDLPWNPMAIEQRIGRIHRIGQTRDVFVFNLAAKNTIEYYILDILDKKINMFEMVVGEMDMILGDIHDEEDFSDIVMDAWANTQDEESIKEKMNQIGDRLVENKKQYLKVKELDDSLFGDSMKVRKGD